MLLDGYAHPQMLDALMKMKRLTGDQSPTYELQERAMKGAKERARECAAPSRPL